MNPATFAEPAAAAPMAAPVIANDLPLENGRPYEIIDGQRVEKIMSAVEIAVASRLMGRLDAFTFNKLGRVFMEMLYNLGPDFPNNRCPDVSFVSYKRWPKEQTIPPDNAWAVVPNLAVEVVSRSNSAHSVLEKIAEYFQAGVEKVWAVYPNVRQVQVFHSPTQITVLSEQDELDDGDLLPGWKMPVAELFVL